MEPRPTPDPDPDPDHAQVDDEAADVEPDSGRGEGLLDRLRATGVGVEDPNIVGDVGPLDIPPGADPDRTISPDLPVVEGDEPGEV